MDQEEIGRTSFDDAPGRCFSQQVSAADRRGRERFPRLEAGFDERLDLPGEVVRPQGSAAEIRPGERGGRSRSPALADAIRSFPSSLTNRGKVVVCAKEAQERKIARVLTRN